MQCRAIPPASSRPLPQKLPSLRACKHLATSAPTDFPCLQTNLAASAPTDLRRVSIVERGEESRKAMNAEAAGRVALRNLVVDSAPIVLAGE